MLVILKGQARFLAFSLSNSGVLCQWVRVPPEAAYSFFFEKLMPSALASCTALLFHLPVKMCTHNKMIFPYVM